MLLVLFCILFLFLDFIFIGRLDNISSAQKKGPGCGFCRKAIEKALGDRDLSSLVYILNADIVARRKSRAHNFARLARHLVFAPSVT